MMLPSLSIPLEVLEGRSTRTETNITNLLAQAEPDSKKKGPQEN